MTTKKQDVAVIGAGAAACAVCCAGPVLGFLAAAGIGTALGVALFGSIALVFGALAVLVVVRRRRRSRPTCESATEQPVEMIRHE